MEDGKKRISSLFSFPICVRPRKSSSSLLLLRLLRLLLLILLLLLLLSLVKHRDPGESLQGALAGREERHRGGRRGRRRRKRRARSSSSAAAAVRLPLRDKGQRCGLESRGVPFERCRCRGRGQPVDVERHFEASFFSVSFFRFRSSRGGVSTAGRGKKGIKQSKSRNHSLSLCLFLSFSLPFSSLCLLEGADSTGAPVTLAGRREQKEGKKRREGRKKMRVCFREKK